MNPELALNQRDPLNREPVASNQQLLQEQQILPQIQQDTVQQEMTVLAVTKGIVGYVDDAHVSQHVQMHPQPPLSLRHILG